VVDSVPVVDLITARQVSIDDTWGSAIMRHFSLGTVVARGKKAGIWAFKKKRGGGCSGIWNAGWVETARKMGETNKEI